MLQAAVVKALDPGLYTIESNNRQVALHLDPPPQGSDGGSPRGPMKLARVSWANVTKWNVQAHAGNEDAFYISSTDNNAAHAEYMIVGEGTDVLVGQEQFAQEWVIESTGDLNDTYTIRTNSDDDPLVITINNLHLDQVVLQEYEESYFQKWYFVPASAPE
ncbi:hypothetical protein DFQ26_002633 [Actinomortierella ambigua]|nr:hypothetical protein DFQ26_002633 [Actinomortierella ambigua]